MAKNFNDLFDAWSETYDQTVGGTDVEYKEVFACYEQILDEVAKRSKGYIVEFGVGTGNLTEKFLKNGFEIYGIEPSEGMRNRAKEKIPNVTIVEGDFLTFPIPEKKPDTIASTYAFHHLTDEEKRKAVALYSEILNESGKIVFADTVFINEAAKQAIIEEALRNNYNRLAVDLQTEYYTTIPVLKKIFEENGFQVTFNQMNTFVWLMDAEKRRENE